MILHPDGKVEGTPEEIAQWKELQINKKLNNITVNISGYSWDKANADKLLNEIEKRFKEYGLVMS